MTERQHLNYCGRLQWLVNNASLVLLVEKLCHDYDFEKCPYFHHSEKVGRTAIYCPIFVFILMNVTINLLLLLLLLLLPNFS